MIRELEKSFGNFLPSSQIKRLAEDVCRESRCERQGKMVVKIFHKIFALLIMTEAVWAPPRFLDEDVSEGDLPLAFSKSSGRTEVRRKGSSVPLECFDSGRWSPMKLRSFHEEQWTMQLLPPMDDWKYESGHEIKVPRIAGPHLRRVRPHNAEHYANDAWGWISNRHTSI